MRKKRPSTPYLSGRSTSSVIFLRRRNKGLTTSSNVARAPARVMVKLFAPRAFQPVMELFQFCRINAAIQTTMSIGSSKNWVAFADSYATTRPRSTFATRRNTSFFRQVVFTVVLCAWAGNQQQSQQGRSGEKFLEMTQMNHSLLS
jgi:hypothetical protein